MYVILTVLERPRQISLYQSDPDKMREVARTTYKSYQATLTPDKKRAAVRAAYRGDSDKKKAAVRAAYCADPDKKKTT